MVKANGKLLDGKADGNRRSKVSSWKSVTSRMPQASVLAAVRFLMYVNDVYASWTSFADDW